MTPRLLFISNLFPTIEEPYRGLDNATLLHALRGSFEIRVISPRPVLPWASRTFSAREEDAAFEPLWVSCAYIPKIGGAVNHLLMARSLRYRVEQMVRAFRPDVILASWIFPDACAVLRLGCAPVVAVAQGSDIHQYLQMGSRRRVIAKYLPNAKAVVTRSRELARLLESAGISAAKLHPVYNGVCLETFQPRDQAVARLENSLPQSRRILLFAGNFVAVKNPLLLVRAFSRLAGEPLLVMAGGGALEPALRDLAKRLGISSRVIFAGRKSAGEIASLMNAADLLVLPSRNEGVPNVILEAFASGLPVVASRVGGIPEVLDGDHLGRMVPPGDLDALTSALRDQLATPRDSAATRRHGEQFSWDAAAAQYRELLLAP